MKATPLQLKIRELCDNPKDETQHYFYTLFLIDYGCRGDAPLEYLRQQLEPFFKRLNVMTPVEVILEDLVHQGFLIKFENLGLMRYRDANYDQRPPEEEEYR